MTLLWLIPGFLLLVAGAELLIRGGSALALRLGLPPLVVGLTVVAFGTSSPELVVSLQAAVTGRGDISLGNVVGSNICNIALILGLAALIRPLKIQSQLIRLDVPIMIGCSLLLGTMLTDARLSRAEGAVLLVGIAGYIWLSLRKARRESRQVQEALLAVESIPDASRRSLFRDLILVVGGVFVLVLGADLFIRGAVAAARGLGVSEAVIGLTLVALGTSLPELATSTVAAVKKQGDIAIGNIIGSNIFNILGILGVAALVRPFRGSGIGRTDLATMIGLALLMLPLMRSGFVLSRREGAFLLVIYGLYIGHLAV
jgi:cation:H+ antiporter